MSLVNCSECAREISDKAVTCPQCGVPVGEQSVVIKGVDPFSQYHTPIQGKKSGPLSILGRFGLFFVGPFMVFAGAVIVFLEKKPEQGFMTIFLSVIFMIGCYLWARRV